MFETIFKKLTPDCEPWVLEHTIQLAVEFAREGCKIGTMFVVGDEEAALRQSRPLILDPDRRKVFGCPRARLGQGRVTVLRIDLRGCVLKDPPGHRAAYPRPKKPGLFDLTDPPGPPEHPRRTC